MKKIIYLLIILFIYSCSNKKEVYWCGDHACVDKKERKAYFKKNMVIEIRNKTVFGRIDFMVSPI